jgi:hypothetical protein
MGEQDQGPEEVREPGTTGKYVTTRQGLDIVEQQAGLRADVTAEAGEVDPEALADPEVSILFPDLGILIAGGLSAEQVRKVQALTEEDNPILAIEPDRTYTALD